MNSGCCCPTGQTNPIFRGLIQVPEVTGAQNGMANIAPIPVNARKRPERGRAQLCGAFRKRPLRTQKNCRTKPIFAPFSRAFATARSK